ncbi:hypothetical protein [Algibacter sp.]
MKYSDMLYANFDIALTVLKIQFHKKHKKEEQVILTVVLNVFFHD